MITEREGQEQEEEEEEKLFNESDDVYKIVKELHHPARKKLDLKKNNLKIL
jgi:hypothetical protein